MPFPPSTRGVPSHSRFAETAKGTAGTQQNGWPKGDGDLRAWPKTSETGAESIF